MGRTTLIRSKGLLFVGAFLLVLASGGMVHRETANAACSPLSTTYGQDSFSTANSNAISVPTAGTYRVWARVLIPDATDNNFYMQIPDDSNFCQVQVGGGTNTIPVNTWTWVDFAGGNTSNFINTTLSAGMHTVILAGEAPGVEVDRIILTGDTTSANCNPPTGTGDACANPDNTAPVVSITSPTSGTSLGATTTVTASATDNVAVASVVLYIDGSAVTPNMTAGTAPNYTYSLNPTSLSIGSHSMYSVATDTSGNSSQSATINFTVPDKIAPTGVSVTAPASGATVSGTIALTATASDNIGVSKVEFYVDGTLKATDTTSPYSVSLDTTALSNAAHTITAEAYDAALNHTTSSGVSVTVNNVTSTGDTTAPAVSLTSPSSGATVSGTTTLNATATDNVGVTKVEFYVDGALKNTDTTAPYSYGIDTTGLANGSHAIVAKAYDAASNVGTSTSVSVTVSNPTFLAADINQDGHVNLLDFSLLASKYGQTGSNIGRADINSDGAVNLLDFSLLASKYGQ